MSIIFSNRHEEVSSVGHLGRGTHYSVLRLATWFDDCKLPLKTPKLLDIAVIWDRKHNKEVLNVIEHMYMENLLSPVLFIGESKGTLSVIISPYFKEASNEQSYQAYVSAIIELARSQYHPWTTSVTVYGDPQAKLKIIDSSQERVETYLKNIHMLWDLGLKDFRLGMIKPVLNVVSLIPVM